MKPPAQYAVKIRTILGGGVMRAYGRSSGARVGSWSRCSSRIAANAGGSMYALIATMNGIVAIRMNNN